MDNQNENMEELQVRSFDASLKELEELVVRLESGRLTLEESMAAYEKGVRLVNFCSERLTSAEKKIEQLKKKSDGELTWSDYNPEEK